MEPAGMDYFCEQVQQKDVGRRMQVGQELLEYLGDPARSPDLEQDQQRLDKVIDELTAWVSSSSFKVALLGLDVLGAFVDRLSGCFKPYIGTVLLPLIDRMGDAKDQVREQAQNLILKLMCEAAPPMWVNWKDVFVCKILFFVVKAMQFCQAIACSSKYIWERLAVGFKHKNYRSREGVCLCLVATLNICGAQPLILSKLVPHLCIAFGDSSSQVRDAAILAIVEVYRHVGEKVRIDLTKRGIPPGRDSSPYYLAAYDHVKKYEKKVVRRAEWEEREGEICCERLRKVVVTDHVNSSEDGVGSTVVLYHVDSCVMMDSSVAVAVMTNTVECASGHKDML
ncbi:CLIP-associating protein 1-like protein [Turdus rufiventris]|nr:CLIP-associating protein 1-like protein [Turdus rufiventris]